MERELSLATKEMFLFALYIACMILVNTIGSKINTLLGAWVSVVIFCMAFLFLFTVIAGEANGHKDAALSGDLSIVMLVLLFVMAGICKRIATKEIDSHRLFKVFSYSLIPLCAILVSNG